MGATTDQGDLIFAPDSPPGADMPVGAPWRILVVDDDVEIHRVSRLVLSPFVFKDRPMEIIAAYSGLEARSILAKAEDIAVILLDVVMETDDSGLKLVQFVRQQYANRKTRIILRTGQPGYAPELRVLLDYDINDYRAKAELTAERLITAVAVSLRSYSDIAAAEEATARSQRAQEAVLAKSTFLANMSHELRTPLNAVIGNIELLRLTPLTPRQMDITDSAATAAQILLDVIGDVLDLTKLEADRFELNSTPTDLEAMVREVLDMVRPSALKKNLALRLQMSSAVPPEVLTDPMRLRQILTNLVSNAVKFTADGGVLVRVAVASDRNGVVIVRFAVHDSGIGFDPEKTAAIFEPFVQGENSIERRYGGTGLGLAISKRAVELLGGNIGCRSIPGLGATFWCDIPVVALRDAPSAFVDLQDRTLVLVGFRSAVAAEGWHHYGTRLMLVDDIRGLRHLLDVNADAPPMAIIADFAGLAADPLADTLSGVGIPLVAIVDAGEPRQIHAAVRQGAAAILDPNCTDELLDVLARLDHA